jgi:cytoskeletal protein CcmA (bactofilin family)
MWRNKESQSTAPGAANAPRGPANSGGPSGTTAHPSWLSPTMRVKGEISANEDLLVDGKVEGPISVGEHTLTVGQNGQITGGLAAREIIIYGKVDGNHKVMSESVEIKKNALMVGDVITRRIVIEDGAGFKGSIEIEESSKQVDSKLDKTAVHTLSTSA